MDELTKEFLAESMEGLDRMDRCLTELEVRPHDAEVLGEIFRAVHTIKGTTGFLGFGRLEKLAHAGEDLLGSMRSGMLTADAELIDGLLQLMDRLREILGLIEQTGKEGVRSQDEDSGLIALLAQFALDRELESEDLYVLEDSRGKEVLPLPMKEEVETAILQRATSAVSADAMNNRRGVIAPHSALASGESVEKTLRIDVEVLNRMMNLVGELVLTRNQILQSHMEAANFPELTRRLDTVTVDLRETVMQARMQPVGHLFGKYPRLVRDLAKLCGKKVRIEFSGQETGLDKSLLEAIKDPLTHAVRNAVDHGIEEPAMRVLAGKADEGTVSLRAWHQGGSVVIEVADDGGGISKERVVAKALERRLITDVQATTISERDALQLIFLPGFSTAAKVTHVSGRGVGMDVVRANVEKVGGTVEVESRTGFGTVLRLRMPLTLAIVPALVVRSGDQSFCLPQGSLAELIYVSDRESASAIERIGDAELYRLRDHLLPLVWLTRLLGLSQTPEPGLEHGFYVAVLEAEGCRFGLVVDELMAPEEIVVKPLSSILRNIGLFSGAAVLGSGTLAMILDIAAIALRSGIRAEPEKGAAHELAELKESGGESLFLIYEDCIAGPHVERVALPLATVERIETVAFSDVEYAGGRALLQYRGELLPLEDAGGVLLDSRVDGVESFMSVLICRPPSHTQEASGAKAKKSGRVGVIVRRVIDVAGGALLENSTVLGETRVAMVQNRLTVVSRAFEESSSWKEVA